MNAPSYASPPSHLLTPAVLSPAGAQFSNACTAADVAEVHLNLQFNLFKFCAGVFGVADANGGRFCVDSL